VNPTYSRETDSRYLLAQSVKLLPGLANAVILGFRSRRDLTKIFVLT
jgi:hypothetical protein